MQTAFKGLANLLLYAHLSQCNYCSILSQQCLTISAEIVLPVRMYFNSTGKFPNIYTFYFSSNLFNLQDTVPVKAKKALLYQSNTIS